MKIVLIFLLKLLVSYAQAGVKVDANHEWNVLNIPDCE